MFDSIVTYKISDLMIAVKIKEICARSSKEFSNAKTVEELTEILSRNRRSLIVCDLPRVKTELADVKRIASLHNCQVFGYYPHVDKETETIARSLKVEYVVPRSTLQSTLRSLVA